MSLVLDYLALGSLSGTPSELQVVGTFSGGTDVAANVADLVWSFHEVRSTLYS